MSTLKSAVAVILITLALTVLGAWMRSVGLLTLGWLIILAGALSGCTAVGYAVWRRTDQLLSGLFCAGILVLVGGGTLQVLTYRTAGSIWVGVAVFCNLVFICSFVPLVKEDMKNMTKRIQDEDGVQQVEECLMTKLNTGETKEHWRQRLVAMSDDELYRHCERYIWLSAYARNNPTSDYHFLCDAGYDECARRDKLEIYERAHAAAANG